jgi:hypothetical protein
LLITEQDGRFHPMSRNEHRGNSFLGIDTSTLEGELRAGMGATVLLRLARAIDP